MNTVSNYYRRGFVKQDSMVGLGATVVMSASPAIFATCMTDSGTPAPSGGEKIRTKEWPGWPFRYA